MTKKSKKYLDLSVCIISQPENADGVFAAIKSLPNRDVEVCVLWNKPAENESLTDYENMYIGKRLVRAKLWQYAGKFHFAKARNMCDDMATREWILWLDSDDLLLEHQHKKIEYIVNTTPAGYGCVMATVTSFIPHLNKPGGAYIASPQMRMYRRSIDARWVGAIHEVKAQIILSMGYAKVETDLLVFHKGYAVDKSVLLAKAERNLDGLIRQVAAADAGEMLNAYYRDLLVRETNNFRILQEAEHGS